MKKRKKSRSAFNITFNITEDCNLACKYCYEVNKKRKTMDLETAKKFIDILLYDDNPIELNSLNSHKYENWIYEGITLDFIGGDALMHPKLVDQILSYWVKKVYTLDTKNAKKWRQNWRASISSNGTLFENPEVRSFLEDWKDVISLCVSIDGCPTIHDMNRIYVDGRPSMPTILKWWDWYRERFPYDSETTKATCSRNSIPYLYESLKFMHETLGLTNINQNFIMEDTGCAEEDYEELRRQMDLCIDYVYDHRDNLYWSMIDKQEFAEHKRSDGSDWLYKGKCGGGLMPALGINGDIYPCFRFLPHTQEKKSPLICGDVNRGLYNKKAFAEVTESAYRVNCTKDEKCRECEYESACNYCIAGCYSEFGEFRRTTYICEITKIQCEAAKKYWKRLGEL